MNGSSEPTGLESADTSDTVDSAVRRGGYEVGDLSTLSQAIKVCIRHHEHAAAEALQDAKDRVVLSFAACSLGEGKRSGEEVHGEDPEAAEVG